MKSGRPDGRVIIAILPVREESRIVLRWPRSSRHRRTGRPQCRAARPFGRTRSAVGSVPLTRVESPGRARMPARGATTNMPMMRGALTESVIAGYKVRVQVYSDGADRVKAVALVR